VEGVGFVTPLPLLGRRSEPIRPVGTSGPGAQMFRPETREGISLAVASPAVFNTLGIQLASGRAYTDADLRAGPANRPAVVSQTLARMLSPTGEALGTQ